MGYANRLIIKQFPDLSEDGDPIFVTILNPKTLSLNKLTPDDVPVDDNGRPIDPDQAMGATYKVLAGLVHDWHVYDADDLSTTPAPLPLPATPDTIAKLPLEILNDLLEELKGVISVPQ